MKKFTPYKRIDFYAFKEHRFKTLKDFEYFLHLANKAPDYIVVDNLLYTMEEYDHSGREIIYQNRRTKKVIEVDTSNRYSDSGFRDAEVIGYPAISHRPDIVYAD